VVEKGASPKAPASPVFLVQKVARGAASDNRGPAELALRVFLIPPREIPGLVLARIGGTR